MWIKSSYYYVYVIKINEKLKLKFKMFDELNDLYLYIVMVLRL